MSDNEFIVMRDEVSEAWASGDHETLYRYAMATLVTVLLVVVAPCMVCSCCSAFWSAMARTWRVLSYIFCCGFCARSRSDARPVDPDGQRALCIERAADLACTGARARFVNAFGVIVDVPFCEQHWRSHRRRLAVEACDFDAASQIVRANSTYTFSLRYAVSELDVRAEVSNAITKAKKRHASGGQLYIFTNQRDTMEVEQRAGATYFYKIGMRVFERTDANLDQVAFWEVPENQSTALTEQLVHALLVNDRFARFGATFDKFETDWFLVTQERAKRAVEIVLSAGTEYEKLLDAELCAKFQ